MGSGWFYYGECKSYGLSIFDYIANPTPLLMDNLNDILLRDPNTKLKSFKKGDIIQHAGSSHVSRYYVESGILRSYIIDSKGKEHIFMFAPEGWIVADVESLEYDTPVDLYIDCLEDSVVIAFNNDISSNNVMSQEEIVDYIHLLYRRLGVLQRRVLMLLSAPAIDRYTYFLETYPDLPNRVPQHMIATYLGITPQTLSTLRTKKIL